MWETQLLFYQIRKSTPAFFTRGSNTLQESFGTKLEKPAPEAAETQDENEGAQAPSMNPGPDQLASRVSCNRLCEAEGELREKSCTRVRTPMGVHVGTWTWDLDMEPHRTQKTRMHTQRRQASLYGRPAAWRGMNTSQTVRRVMGAILLATCLCKVAAGGDVPVPGGRRASLQPVGSGGQCLGGPWLFSAKCQILSRQDIPAVTVGLFTPDGAPCCGEAVTTVEVLLSRSTNGRPESIPMTGFLVRDSMSGEPGAAMTLEFSGLRTTHPVAGVFNLTFSTFYNGAALEYRVLLYIFPDTLLLRSALVDGQKLTVHDILPSLTLEMIGRNASIAGGGGLRVKARLFNKGGMADVSGSCLLGSTSMPFAGGRASFADLSAQRIAGYGFRVAFFIEGSEKQCVSGVTRITCSEWEEHRGLSGGLGGYWVEMMSPVFTLLPDKLVLSTKILSLNNIARVDASLPLYTVSLHDSKFPLETLKAIVADDGLTVNVTLVSQSDANPVAESHLEGIKSVVIAGGSASFKNLVVRGISGPAFRMRFTVSWNDFCLLRNRDPSCLGECCLFSQNFTVYPYAMQMSPLVVPDSIAGDAVG